MGQSMRISERSLRRTDDDIPDRVQALLFGSALARGKRDAVKVAQAASQVQSLELIVGLGSLRSLEGGEEATTPERATVALDGGVGGSTGSHEGINAGVIFQDLRDTLVHLRETVSSVRFPHVHGTRHTSIGSISNGFGLHSSTSTSVRMARVCSASFVGRATPALVAVKY